nr:hypothetical protein CFP56_52306 [Quercus suber]
MTLERQVDLQTYRSTGACCLMVCRQVHSRGSRSSNQDKPPSHHSQQEETSSIVHHSSRPSPLVSRKVASLAYSLG